ncbi:MAG: hypothetical protein BWY59_02299 [Verrucomicrobia bacterium ADurb.Bin345]|nr:MAG: hypothetical protein BWY59_02299 [Verrucomicrobia bacterium ADurb.Bin345]
MASVSSSKSRLEHRLRELRKESELVREDIRTLGRVVRNREELDRLPKLKSGKYTERPIPPPTRRDPVRGGEETAPAMPPRIIDQPPAPFVPPAQPSGSGPPKAAPASGSATARPRASSTDERFANLFSSGGFLGSVNARQERNVQKNKAIFMLLVVIVVFFVVFQLVFR